MAIFDSPEEVARFVEERIELNKGLLGIAYIGFGEENFLPHYPACVVVPGALNRQWHGTNTFEVFYSVEIYVYHAKLTESYKVRALKDIELATGIRKLLHENLRAPDAQGNARIVGGWVESENPGTLRTGKGERVVGTRLVWVARNVELFK